MILCGATCVTFTSTSATACRFFLHFLHFFFYVISRFINLVTSCINLVFNATCVDFASASATAVRSFFSANCTGLCTASAAGPGTTRNGYTATSQKADDSDSSKNLLQFLCVHGQFSLARIRLFPNEKDKIDITYNDHKLYFIILSQFNIICQKHSQQQPFLFS